MWKSLISSRPLFLLASLGASIHLMRPAPEPAPVSEPEPLTCPEVAPCPPSEAEAAAAWRALALDALRDLRAEADLADEGIVRLSTWAWLIHEEVIDEDLFIDTTGAQSVRAYPYRRDGEAVGIRLSAVRRDTLLHRLGMRNGDVLLRINGGSVLGSSRCFSTIQARPDNIELELLRRGQRRVLVWLIHRPAEEEDEAR